MCATFEFRFKCAWVGVVLVLHRSLSMQVCWQAAFYCKFGGKNEMQSKNWYSHIFGGEWGNIGMMITWLEACAY